MKKLFLVVLILFLSLPLWSQVSGCLENENNLREGQFTGGFQWWIQGNFSNSKFGYFGWALVSKNWSEIYPGFYWQPFSWLQIGAGLGIEQGQSKPRFGAFLWAGKDKIYFTAFLEEWGSGLWWRALAMYRLNQIAQIGLMSQHKLGIGPKMEVEFYKPFSFWAAILVFGQEDSGVTLFGGIKLGF